MQDLRSKDKVLKKVRQALTNKTEDRNLDIDHTSSVYHKIQDSLDISFAEEFSKVNGNFIFCENNKEFINSFKLLLAEKKWNSLFCIDKTVQNALEQAGIPYFKQENDFKDIDVSITRCEYLIARLGSIMVSSALDSGRRLNVYPHAHIVIARSNQLVEDIKDAFEGIKQKYGDDMPSMISLITGPSRTADIEKTLVMGAHGPKEIYVFLIDE